MAKLVEILARELKEWPEGAIRITQDVTGLTMIEYPSYIHVDGAYQVSKDRHTAFVTRPQWKAERARIATTNRKATQEAREIAETGTMTNEEQELAAIACGKRSKEDQELWDRVAIWAMQGLMPVYWDTIEQYDSAEQMVKCHTESAFDYADAFMAERAKRIKGVLDGRTTEKTCPRA